MYACMCMCEYMPHKSELHWHGVIRTRSFKTCFPLVVSGHGHGPVDSAGIDCHPVCRIYSCVYTQLNIMIYLGDAYHMCMCICVCVRVCMCCTRKLKWILWVPGCVHACAYMCTCLVNVVNCTGTGSFQLGRLWPVSHLFWVATAMAPWTVPRLVIFLEP